MEPTLAQVLASDDHLDLIEHDARLGGEAGPEEVTP
jgi:hypothetical protein